MCVHVSMRAYVRERECLCVCYFHTIVAQTRSCTHTYTHINTQAHTHHTHMTQCGTRARRCNGGTHPDMSDRAHHHAAASRRGAFVTAMHGTNGTYIRSEGSAIALAHSHANMSKCENNHARAG